MQPLQRKKSIICFFIFFLIVNNTLFAQGALNETKKDTTYSKTHFLWFTGHWSKTKKNVFITTATTDSTEGGVMKLGGSSTITVNANGSVNISTQSIDDWNKDIINGENKLEKTEKEMTSPENEQKEWAYHFNEAALPLLDTLKAQWTANKIDNKSDALNPENNNDKEGQALQKLANNVSNGCKTMQPKYQAIVDFYHKHLHDKDANFNNPAPPEMEYECMACDSSQEKNYKKVCDAYIDNFFKPESGFIKDGLSFIRQLVLLGRYSDIGGGGSSSGNDVMDDKLGPLFSKGGPCSYVYDEDLNKIVLWLAARCLWRAEKLLRDNRNNYKVVEPVIRVFLEAAKQNCLLGNNVDLEQNSDLYQIVYNAFEHYYNNLVEKQDWSQLANIPVIFGLEKQYELLGGNQIDNSEFITKILKTLNSFELNIEMDVKAGKDGGYILSHLKGKAKIAPEFRYGSDSCYEWVVIEDKPDALGQPVKKVNQKIELDLLDNEIITPKYRPTYTGTKKYYTMLWQLKMNYCHPGKDTILMGSFIPDPNPMAGTWVYPNDPHSVPSGINGEDHYFQDINKMKELAQSGAATQQANIIKEQSEKIVAQMKTLANQMNGSHDASQLGNYQKMLNMGNQIKQLTNNANVAPILYIDFPLQIENNSAILFNKRFDAKQMNPDLAPVLDHGYFTVDIEYKK